jgi:cysteinyl-tRNA synthetase
LPLAGAAASAKSHPPKIEFDFDAPGQSRRKGVYPLRLYNTLTRTKENFAPIEEANVRLYACGPTVYDHLHIGNGRMLIVFDVLCRLLRHLYGDAHVTYVRNITDVDDKINARAAERGISIRDLTDEMSAIFHEDAKALGCLPPSSEPRATEHIGEITALIERLIAKGHAYAVDRHVLFDVTSMPAYGQLSRRTLDEMIAGARVEVAPYKRSPMDFVLWKPSTGKEPSWASPWGHGRPGWHIECSAMSWKHLGETFDIHGGGIDLVFPHHENEIAQSCAAFGHEKMANFWVHNGHLQVEGEKMSKSLGNFVTIHELLHTDKFGGRSWPGEVLRLAILKTHYRQPLDFTVKALEEAEQTLKKWQGYASLSDRFDEPFPEFIEAMEDDLNTPEAVSKIRSLTRVGIFIGSTQVGDSMLASPEVIERSSAALRGCLQLLGLSRVCEPDWNRSVAEISATRRAEIEDFVARRAKARAAKDFAESDRIRDELAAMGIALKDNKDGTTTWEPKR